VHIAGARLPHQGIAGGRLSAHPRRRTVRTSHGLAINEVGARTAIIREDHRGAWCLADPTGAYVHSLGRASGALISRIRAHWRDVV